MPPSATLRDDFNRADENPLTKGGQWLTAAPRYANPLQVQSNQAGGTSSGGGSGSSSANTWGAAYPSPVDAYVTIATLPTVADSTVGLELFLQSAHGNTAVSGYHCSFARDSSPTYDAFIIRITNGTGDFLMWDAAGLTLSAGDKLGVRVTAVDVEFWRYTGGAWSLLGSGSQNGVGTAHGADDTYRGVMHCVLLGLTHSLVTRFDDFHFGPANTPPDDNCCPDDGGGEGPDDDPDDPGNPGEKDPRRFPDPLPDWQAQCTGGANFLSAADVVPPENWGGIGVVVLP